MSAFALPLRSRASRRALPVARRLTTRVHRRLRRLSRLRRVAFASADFDFAALSADAPNWLAELTERNA